MWDQLAVILSLLGSLVLFVLVVFAAYLCAKFLGHRWNPSGARGGSIEVVGRLPLGTDRSVIIVRTAGKALLLGVTAQQIRLITELDPDQLPPAPPEEVPGDFSATFQKVLGDLGTHKKEKKGSSNE